jgi:hypothetical protein
MANQDRLQLSYLTIRRSLGILGILLPLLMFASSLLAGATAVRVSISSYYFTNARDLLVGVLCALTLFLVSYRGYGRSDDIASSLAGLCALGVALFPACGESRADAQFLFFRQLDPAACTVVHFICAGSFFCLLAFMSGFLFTRTDPSGRRKPTRRKRQRNLVYRICALVMAAALAGMLAVNLLPAGHPVHALNPIFWLEAAALLAFGISWLVKGETLLRD